MVNEVSVRSIPIVAAVALLVATAACSPGTLPGAPSPVTIGGGGARYNGSITYRRVAGAAYALTESAQTLNLSLTMRGTNQVFGRFETAESSGTISGTVNGTLASGAFDATVLVSSVVRQGTGSITCEGRGQITGSFSGVNVTWTSASIGYDNCPGLTVASSAQAIAVSPIPGEFGSRANVVISVVGGTSIVRSTCPDGSAGYPFTVDMTERSGVSVTFDPTFVAEDAARRQTVLDMPFTELAGGSRRTYGVCSPAVGTYQAFFSGVDANGNRVRVASPVVTFVP